jgi:hypothetical protein
MRGLALESKSQLLTAIEGLRQIVSDRDKPTLEFKPGELVVIDCYRGGSMGKRAILWDIILATMQEHFEVIENGEERKKGRKEHYLLVFDEFHQIASQRTDGNVRAFGARLKDITRLGRHQHISVIAASQTPADFTFPADTWEAANIVLFHRLNGRVHVGEVPPGLWREAANQPGLDALPIGTAWYCSKNPDDASAELLKGKVKVNYQK